MADDATNRTERATPKKREEARKRGQVPRSVEIGPAAQLLVFLGIASVGAPWAVGQAREVMVSWLAAPARLVGQDDLLGAVAPLAARSGMAMLAVTAPLLFATAAVGIAVMVAQVGWKPNLELIVPDATRLSPAAGLRRIFSPDGLINLPKGLLKMGLLFWVAYAVLVEVGSQAIATPDMTADQLLLFAGDGMFRLLWVMAFALGLIGALDYIWARWRHEQSIKMSRQEIKDELREADGDPQIKARFRRSHREIAKRRMLTEVKTADVVLVNPIHVAVALRYRAVEMRAPIVVAKGAGELCEKIKDAARTAGVPIVERRALARALFRQVKLGAEIPPTLYTAVAEILAYIFSLRAQRAEAV
jgi:flagellar biosynthetic protein FlhB